MTESFFVHLTANLLQEGYSVRFQAKGTSMYPTIEDGERVVVEPVEPSQVKRGDIILYLGQRGVIAHRVMAIEYGRDERAGAALSARDILILCGDACDFPDEPVEVSRILGRVVAVERAGRSIDLESCFAKRVSAVHLRRAISRRLPRVAHLLRTCRDLFRVTLKANA